MSKPSDEVARRVAARLAPRISPTLPAYVERTLAGVALNDDEATQRTPDVAVIISFVTLIVTLARFTWDVSRELSKPKADALNDTELLLFRKLLADSIENHPQLRIQAPVEVRAALVEAVADETIAEAKQRAAKAPGE